MADDSFGGAGNFVNPAYATPEQLKWQRLLANQLMTPQPVTRHPMEGIANIVRGLVGGYQMRNAADSEQKYLSALQDAASKATVDTYGHAQQESPSQYNVPGHGPVSDAGGADEQTAAMGQSLPSLPGGIPMPPARPQMADRFPSLDIANGNPALASADPQAKDAFLRRGIADSTGVSPTGALPQVAQMGALPPADRAAMVQALGARPAAGGPPPYAPSGATPDATPVQSVSVRRPGEADLPPNAEPTQAGPGLQPQVANPQMTPEKQAQIKQLLGLGMHPMAPPMMQEFVKNNVMPGVMQDVAGRTLRGSPMVGYSPIPGVAQGVASDFHGPGGIQAKMISQMGPNGQWRNQLLTPNTGTGGPTGTARSEPDLSSIGGMMEAEANQKGKVKGAEDLAAAKVEPIKEAITAAAEAPKTINMLDQIIDAYNSGGDKISGGPAGKKILEMKQFVKQALNVDLGGLKESEIIDHTTTGLATAMIKQLTSRGTQLEFTSAVSQNPGILMSNEGAKYMASLMKQQTEQAQKFGPIAAKIKDPDTFLDVQHAYYETHPLVSPFTHKPLVGPAIAEDFQRLQAANQPGKAAGIPAPQTAVNKATGQKLILQGNQWVPAP